MKSNLSNLNPSKHTSGAGFPSKSPSKSRLSSSSQSKIEKAASKKAQREAEAKKLAEGYKRFNIKHAPRTDNRRRFRHFIDRINKRQWALLSDSCARQLKYNSRDISLYELVNYFQQEFGGKTLTHMEVMTAVGGRFPDDGPVGARLRVRSSPPSNDGVVTIAPRKSTEYARHMLVYFNDKFEICEICDICDTSTAQPSASGAVQKIPSLPTLRPPPPRASIDMPEFFTNYLTTINDTFGGLQDGGKALHDFCKPPPETSEPNAPSVSWNGVKLRIPQFCSLSRDVFDHFAELEIRAHTVLHHEKRQMLFVRTEYEGRLIRPFAGAMPSGRSAQWSELSVYWLEQGKISHVLSVTDWEELRRQMGAA